MPAPKPDRAPTAPQRPPRPHLDPAVAKALQEQDLDMEGLAIAAAMEINGLRESCRRCTAVLAFIVRNGPFPEAVADLLLKELGTSLAEVPGIPLVVEEPDGKPH